MPNPSFRRTFNHQVGKDKGLHSFSKGISLKDRITPLEFELTYFDAAVQFFSHNTMETSPKL